MASKRTLKLRAKQPVDRVHQPMPPSGRRPPKKEKHRHHVLLPWGDVVAIKVTAPLPWRTRARRRRHNRLARASRKANR